MNNSREKILAILDQSGNIFQSDGYHIHINSQRNGITRFANNQITDNQYFADADITLRSFLGMREGVAVVNQLNGESIREGIKRAENLARKSPENPEFVGPPGLQEYSEVGGFDDDTAQSSPEARIAFIRDAVTQCRERGLVTAGYLQTTEETVATLSSTGSRGYHKNTTAIFSMTAKTDDGSGSGWTLRWARSLKDLDIPALVESAAQKGELSKNPADIKPGRYNVVLEPVACEYLLYNLTHHFSARNAEEGKSFLANFDSDGNPSGTRVGEKVFSNMFTMSRQVNDPAIQMHPFDTEGTALNDVTFVENGVLKNLVFDRYWAKKNNVQPTGEITGIQMAGSNRSVEDLVKQAQDGILVTRLWYIRHVDWMKSGVTGMTRDGTFRIEGGEIAGPVKNLRFNEELRRVFKDITALGTVDNFWNYLSPALIVPDFNFTSTTESI